jgi:hypothetical protein
LFLASDLNLGKYDTIFNMRIARSRRLVQQSNRTTVEDTTIGENNVKQEYDTKATGILPLHTCRICQTSFASANSYIIHMNQAHKKTDPDGCSWHCEPCDTKYKTLHILRIHLRKKHYLKLSSLASRKILT